jgi:hypothetical protein
MEWVRESSKLLSNFSNNELVKEIPCISLRTFLRTTILRKHFQIFGHEYLNDLPSPFSLQGYKSVDSLKARCSMDFLQEESDQIINGNYEIWEVS